MLCMRYNVAFCSFLLKIGQSCLARGSRTAAYFLPFLFVVVYPNMRITRIHRQAMLYLLLTPAHHWLRCWAKGGHAHHLPIQCLAHLLRLIFPLYLSSGLDGTTCSVPYLIDCFIILSPLLLFLVPLTDDCPCWYGCNVLFPYEPLVLAAITLTMMPFSPSVNSSRFTHVRLQARPGT